MDNKKYGRWTILEEKQGKFLCKCECGTEKLVNPSNLLGGRTKSCGCLSNELKSKRRLIDLTGRTFNKWTVIKRVANDKWNMTKYLCRCECGTEKEIYAKHLNKGDSNGCHKCSIKKGEEHKQWNGCGDISGAWWATHIGASDRLRNGNITPVKITKQYAWELFEKQNKKCSLSGLDLIISNNSKLNTASLDRVDSSKGYIEGNVQWVHKHINIMKNIYTQQYFIEMCKNVANSN